MLSKAMRHMEDEEVVEAVLHPSVFESQFLKWHVFAVLLAAVNAYAVFSGAELGSVLPSWLSQQDLWMGFSIPALLIGVTEVRRRITWYYFTDRKIMRETGILNKDYVTIHYTNITETNLRQPLYKVIFGIGDVLLSTAGKDGVELAVKGIRHPEEYKVMVGSKSSVAHLPHHAKTSNNHNHISVSGLEAELHRIQQQRDDLEHSFSNKHIGKYEYERHWYMLEGEERLVEHFLERIGADTTDDNQ